MTVIGGPGRKCPGGALVEECYESDLGLKESKEVEMSDLSHKGDAGASREVMRIIERIYKRAKVLKNMYERRDENSQDDNALVVDSR